MTEDATTATPDTPPAHTFNLADLWLSVAHRIPERTALVVGPQRRTFAELADRAQRFGHFLVSQGIKPGDYVALFLRNDVAYVEALLGAFLVRAVPVNVNFRFTPGELSEILADCQPKAILVHRHLSGTLAQIDAGLRPPLTVLVDDVVEGLPGKTAELDGALLYEEVLAAQPDGLPEVEGRSGDDIYLMYTGGTTGKPKGVMWRHEDAFYACLGAGDYWRLGNPVSTPEELVDRIGHPVVMLTVAPMMHAAAQWTTLACTISGGCMVQLPGSFDAETLWGLAESEQANALILVGDATARPALAAWEANPGRWTTNLFAISNGGAPMSKSLKERMLQAFPNVFVSDGFGSSEVGTQGVEKLEDGEREDNLVRFKAGPGAVVLGEDNQPVTPGSGLVGRMAQTGYLPLGYLGDPEKTAATFPVIDGVRYCLTGDLATVDEDGTIQLLGRGSQSINTGGEKVYPEEVEMALLDLPKVRDAVVVGVPDDRWGSAVAAVISLTDPAQRPTVEEVREALRDKLAGYKLPRQLIVVDEVQRTTVGKSDYRWASKVAEEHLGRAPS